VDLQSAEMERPVAPLELFFDLVFVFGFTQVTTLLSHEPTWTGVGHALLILVALWWAWAAYAWLTSTFDPEEGAVLATVLVATGAMFVAALAVPEAFGNEGVVFGIAFFVVNAMQAALYALSARGDGALFAAVLRTAPWVLGGSALIVAAGFADGSLRTALWLAAIAVGFIGPALQGLGGWRPQPGHFVERHGLIVIIAIGESLVAIGLGARGIHLSARVVVGALLGLFVAGSFWLAYFDFFAIRGRQLLSNARGEERAAIARDVYTYFHLPMIVGIVLFAFATKSALAHIDTELGTVEAFALCGGSAMYLAVFPSLRYRLSRTLSWGRLTAAIVCALLIPVATAVRPLVALALVAGVWAGLHAYELIWYRAARAETRLQRFPAA
jgi:low temperature requirement protein LtrA